MNKELEHDKKAILCLTEEFSKFVRESIAQGHLENFEDRHDFLKAALETFLEMEDGGC
jgi:hypothetical protein